MAEVEVYTVKSMQQLDALLIEDRGMKKKVQAIIRKVLLKARSDASKSIHGQLSNDPRQAYRAVKSTVYRRLLGGNISILSKRKASKTRVKIEHERKQVIDKNGQHRGGNRRKRSKRAYDLDSYWGNDRGFILRFLNSGTAERAAYGYGNARRGNIKPRNFFGASSQKAMETASERFCQLIDEEIERINKEYNG